MAAVSAATCGKNPELASVFLYFRKTVKYLAGESGEPGDFLPAVAETPPVQPYSIRNKQT